MSAVEFSHPDGDHVLIFHAETSCMIRIETQPNLPGWIELGYSFHDNPILIDTDDEWDAFVEMIECADQVQKRARWARAQYSKEQKP